VTGQSGPLVVVGASLAGLRAVEAARSRGYEGPITLIGAEPHLPYDRPPLSKAFLTPGADPTFYCDEHHLRTGLGVDLRLGQPAIGLDPDRAVVHTSAGSVPYGALIIATGSAPRTLPAGAGIPGVVTLRTLDDAAAIRSALAGGARVVVVGAGFIGSEIASSASKYGNPVTVVEAAPVPLQRATGDRLGLALVGLHERNGTQVRLGVGVTGIRGTSHVTGVELSDGQVLEADLVVVGIGSAPATAWLSGSGIELSAADGGIVCDEYLATSLPGVYAAGDVAHWPNQLMDADLVRLENWTSAAEQGAAAARNALFSDQRAPYTTVPYVWSDWYGNRIQFVGHPAADEVNVVSGSLDGPKFVALYRSGDRVMGAVTLNEPGKVMKYRRLIQNRGSWQSALDLFAPKPDSPSGTAETASARVAAGSIQEGS
jgi:NADPH-dependent 2,4-dienoyl-CoA reductase/sulfur reductase-like enzyme